MYDPGGSKSSKASVNDVSALPKPVLHSKKAHRLGDELWDYSVRILERPNIEALKAVTHS